jgi:LacI family transcriptional regulator
MRRNGKTILDVARAAGVSKSTVSRALRNDPLTAPSTRRKIQALARKMGYRPNMIFSIMGSGNRIADRGKNPLPVAYLYDSKNPLDLNYQAGDFHFLRESAHLYGYSLDPYNLNDVTSARSFEKQLYHRGYCGVIIGRLADDASLAFRLDLSRFTVIFNTNTSWKHKYHRVIGDVYFAIQMAWDKSLAAGYRRIGVAACRHQPSLPDDEIRVAATLQRQNRDAALVEPIPPFTGEPGDMASFREWVEIWRPDAVLGFHVGQFYMLRDMGWQIPEEIGFAGLIIRVEDPWHHGISGIRFQDCEVAETTISILDQEIRKRIQGIPEHVLSVHIEPEWIEGKTLPERTSMDSPSRP